MGAALAKLSGEAAVLSRFERLVDESSKVVAKVGSAYQLKRVDGKLEKPAGMSDADYNLACDALLAPKDCPVYLKMHIDRVALAQRIAGGLGAGDKVPVIQFIQNNFTIPKLPGFAALLERQLDFVPHCLEQRDGMFIR